MGTWGHQGLEVEVGDAAHHSGAEAPPCLPARSSRARFDIFKSRYFKKSIQQRSTTCPPPPSAPPIHLHRSHTAAWRGGVWGAQQPRAAKKGVIPLPKRCNPPRKGTAPPPPFQPPMHPHPNAITPSRCSSPNPSLPCILILMQPPPAPPPPGRSSAKRGPTGSRCQGGSQAGWAARGGPLSALMGSWAEGGGAASPPAPY